MLKLNIHNFTIEKNVNIKIMHLSDIHYSNLFDPKLEKNIIESVNKNKPDYIFITGDIIDKYDYLDDKVNQMKIKKFLVNLSLIAKLFLIFGSHDLENVGNPKDEFDKSLKKWKNMMKEYKNIYLLDDNYYQDEFINVYGLTLPFSYYHILPNENVDIVSDKLNNLPNFDNDKYNILLIHSPRRILNNKCLDKIKSIDLILSGHMHDGIVPKIIKKLPTTIGIISPHKTLFPKYARGKKIKKIDNHEIALFITGGVTKISPALPNYMKWFSRFYDNEIEIINIRSKNGNNNR